MKLDVKDLYDGIKDYMDKEVTLQGWIKNHRKQKEFGFIDFSDGTSFKHVQLVYDNSLEDFDEIAKLHIGCAITVTGTIIKSEGAGQEFELKVKSIKLEGDCPEDYPIQPKRHSNEFFCLLFVVLLVLKEIFTLKKKKERTRQSFRRDFNVQDFY